MAITIKKVETRKDLDAFIKFTNRLYKGNAFFVPNLHLDMLNTLDKRKNPAFEFCEADYFLAYKDGKVAGRIAAIINKRANTVWGKKETRFGWIDFIDDVEVSRALLETAAQWGKERGMEYLQGPLGFTDFDPEGMLVEGYDQLSTMSTIYNYPYYPRHMEQLGFEKDVDWTGAEEIQPENQKIHLLESLGEGLRAEDFPTDERSLHPVVRVRPPVGRADRALHQDVPARHRPEDGDADTRLR